MIGESGYLGMRMVSLLRGLGLAVLLAGCGSGVIQTFQPDYGRFGANFVTFEYPFTTAGEAEAKRRAQSQCAAKKQAAVMTSRACSLTRCTTDFQCMSPDEAAVYSQQPGGKPQAGP